jgi:hypothetical protein
MRELPGRSQGRRESTAEDADQDVGRQRMVRHGSKSVSEPLGQFIKSKGGITACAARFSRECKKVKLNATKWCAQRQ